MASTVGATVHFDELVVAQSDKITPGTVQTLVIEFDQTLVAFDESSRVNPENQSPSLKDEIPKVSQSAKKWVVKQPNLTSGTTSQILASASQSRPTSTEAGPSNAPLSRRAKQRQRQNQARRRARTLVSFDGFHYRPKDDQSMVVKPNEDRKTEKRQNDEPRPHTRNHEPRLQHEGPQRQDERRPDDEPRHKRRTRRQPRQARVPKQSRGFHLHETESAGNAPTHDLRDYLTRKRDASQMQSRCCCEKLISAMLDRCPPAPQPTVFERLSDPSIGRRRFRHKRQTTRKRNNPGATINMVGRSGSKTDSPDSSDPEFSPGLHEALFEGQGVYQRTRSRTGVAIPFDYRRLAGLSGGADEEPENSGIATSQPSNTDLSEQVSVHMADREEEMTRRIEEQQATILAQQESIRRLEIMMEKLVGKKKVEEGGSKSRREGNEDEHDAHSVSFEAESNHHTKERDDKMHDFQKQLDALKLQGHFKELGVTRPYPPEWDDVPYPPKFKPLNLVQFDGKSSPSQHIYYFQAQTGHITGNDPIMTRLFISTLRGVAFEWFRRLEPGTVNSWKDLERLFMARFFDDDTEVSVATLLAEKQKKTESVSTFVKRFRNRSLHSRDQVSEATLIEMCRNNLSINVLSKMGAVEARSWRDLVWQGEQVENMLKRIEAEELQDSHPSKVPHLSNN